MINFAYSIKRSYHTIFYWSTLRSTNIQFSMLSFWSGPWDILLSSIYLTHALYRVRAIELVVLFPSRDVGGVPEGGAGAGGRRNGVGMGKGGHQGHVGPHPLDWRVAHARPQVQPPSLSLPLFLTTNDPTLIKGTFTRVLIKSRVTWDRSVQSQPLRAWKLGFTTSHGVPSTKFQFTRGRFVQSQPLRAWKLGLISISYGVPSPTS